MVAGGLSSIDMENFPGHKSCTIEVEYRVHDLGYLSHPAHRVECRQRLVRWGTCIGVLMIPGETAFTRIPLFAYSMASALVAALNAPLVREAKAAGTLLIG